MNASEHGRASGAKEARAFALGTAALLLLSACDAPKAAPPTAPKPGTSAGKRGKISEKGGQLQHKNLTVTAVEGYMNGQLDLSVAKERITAADKKALGEGVRLIEKFSVRSHNDASAQLLIDVDLQGLLQPGELVFIFQSPNPTASEEDEEELVGIFDVDEEKHVFETSLGPPFSEAQQPMFFYVRATQKSRFEDVSSQ